MPSPSSTPSSTRNDKTPPSLRPAALDEETVVVRGVEAHFQRYISVARAFAGATPALFRGDAAVAYHNALRGVDAVRAERSAIDATGARVLWHELLEIPDIALGLVFATERCEASRVSTGEAQRRYARARVVRDIGMASVKTLVKSGDLSAARLKQLTKGRSALDLAGELSALAQLHNEHPEVFRGRSPFTATLAREAATIGEALVRASAPSGIRRKKSAAQHTAAYERDALAALLLDRHAMLERIAGLRWGRALSEHVPALGARVSAGRGKKKDATPATPRSTKTAAKAEKKPRATRKRAEVTTTAASNDATTTAASNDATPTDATAAA
jgi:hypothetical protein